MGQKIYNNKFAIANMANIVANNNQLQSDWLQTTRFLLMLLLCFLNGKYLFKLSKSLTYLNFLATCD